MGLVGRLDVAGNPGREVFLADGSGGELLDHLGGLVVGRSLPGVVVAGDEIAHADVGDAFVAVG
jgi:hypothetical protein